MKPSSFIAGTVKVLNLGEILADFKQAAVTWFFLELAIMGVASRR